MTAAPKDVHGFFNFQLETRWSGVEDFKTILWTKGATIFRTSQVFKDVRMFVGQDGLSFLNYINSQHPNIKSTMEREENQKLPFLDVLLDSHSNHGIITSVFHKKTYTGLLTNYFSFVPFSCKLGLVRTLVDRMEQLQNAGPLRITCLHVSKSFQERSTTQ